MQPHQLFALLALSLIVIVALIYSARKSRPTEIEPCSEEQRATHELEIQRKRREKEFVSIFGFRPEFIRQDRYKKEVLLKLGLLAKEMENTGKDALDNPYVYRESYNWLSRKYSDMLELIGLYDPEFQKMIPHWTELSKFAREWLGKRKFTTDENMKTVCR